jgi:hypothetical protein
LFKRTITVAGLAGAASVAMLLVLPGAAYAANATVSVYYGGTERGHVTHIDDGDAFNVWDDNIDGHGVLAELRQGTALLDYGYAAGAGSFEQFHYDVKEGVKYTLKVCVQDGIFDTTPISCATGTLYE